MTVVDYDRQKAVAYARKWALRRNPAYYDFSIIGGDCTNFASQCLYAGCRIMNDTPVTGWYYYSINNRSAAWTGVEYFFNFLTTNKGKGPYAHVCTLADLAEGDFVQLCRENGDFYHTLVVVGFDEGAPLVATHSYNTLDKRLDKFDFFGLRCIKILGARTI